MSRSLISIKEIADTICEDGGDVTKRYRTYVLRAITREYGRLHRFLSNMTEVVTESFPATNIINMPCGFLQVSKLAIQRGDRLVFIDRGYDYDNRVVQDVNHSGAEMYINGMFSPKYDSSIVTPFYNYRGELVLDAYGSGVRCDGMYSVDTKNGLVMLGSIFPKGVDVVIEYMTDGISSGVNMVPAEMEPCLYNYGLYNLYHHKDDSRWREKKSEYETDYYQLEMLYKFVPIDYIVKLFNQEMHTIDDRL